MLQIEPKDRPTANEIVKPFKEFIENGYGNCDVKLVPK
jgi:hypothetical protein